MITSLAALAWIATWLAIALRLRKQTGRETERTPSLTLLNTCWLLGLILHGTSLLLPWLESGPVAINLLESLSIVAWFTTFLLFLAHIKRPLETMGLIVIPCTLLVLILVSTLAKSGNSIALQNGLGLHIILSLLAYSMLALATLQALLLATQNRFLHNHKPNGFIRKLPPLQDMESLLFQLISAGVILLTLGLISGLIYLDGLFGHQVAHKTILSILAWITFSTLLFGHWRYGWRGKIAIRWTVAGFTLLMFAFWGSKFVIEYLVNHS
uniref:Phosphohydrolase n=1 Tax=uncultured Thiotrichaceae bacterium TaxID=298394 RepID=A0A6S6UDR6_9GAMM|nr:MAG: Phosphohydrolase [uncultured Thiotrichaceae bacterium]